jgi:hypothetical protein
MRKGATSNPINKNEKNITELMKYLSKNARIRKIIDITVYIINIFFLALK